MNILTNCDKFKLDYDFLALFFSDIYFALKLVTKLAKNLKLFKKVYISGLCKSMKLLCIRQLFALIIRLTNFGVVYKKD